MNQKAMMRFARLLVALVALKATVAGADELTDRFTKPPADSRPWCYWYWMNGNISREGIIADLKGMQDVGVGGVLLFDIGIHPQGTVSNRSAEWYELIKLAIREAQKRNIKVSLHCPGWSASGGPWIKPKQGMQELTWSETNVEGPRQFSSKLTKPPHLLDCYRDIVVLAFPTPQNDAPLPAPQLLDTDGKPLDGAALFDNDSKTKANLPCEFDIVYPRPVELRSVFIRAARGGGAVNSSLSAWNESPGQFVEVAKVANCTSGPFSEQLGSASFAPVRAAKFRLSYTGRHANDRVSLQRLEFNRGFRLTNWPAKAGFATDHVAQQPKDLQPQAADVIDPEKIVDLTGKVAADGALSWSVPAGNWTIVRLGFTPTGINVEPAPFGGKGLECDKMSHEVADYHYDQCVTPVLRQIGPALTKETMAYYHVDSYEAGWQNWTEKFPQEFRARRGYDLTKYLPAVTGRVVGDLATTEKFLWDFRRTIGDLYADNHYGELARRCHADGLGFSTEPYGGPFEFLQVGSRADHPMMEFWLPTNPQRPKFLCEAVGAGRTSERRIIGAESFTSGAPDPVRDERWNNHPYSLKALGDYIYCCGVNRFVIHVNAHQPLIGEHFKPGFTCGCNGIHFDRNNTWWEHGAKEWATYLTRCQSLLQTGEHVADVVYFQGNDSPDGVGPYEPALPAGYDFDVCNSEVLDRMRVENGQIVLPHGKRYRYLVLPRHSRVTLASLRKIAALAKAGARIVGALPKESPSLLDAGSQEEYVRLTKQLNPASSFKEVLAADKLAPDFDYDAAAGLVVHSIHRRDGDADIYFVASASAHPGVVNCSFRVTGKTPELWSPDTGTMEPCAVYEETGGVRRIPLRFDPSGSVFVVFRPGKAKVHAVTVERQCAANAAPAKLTILSAQYGPAKDAKRTIDVTKQLTARIQGGQLKLQHFEGLAGDPAPGVSKQLRVEYELDGKPATAVANDGDELHVPALDGKLPPFELSQTGRRLALRAWETGSYRVAFSDGRTQTVEVASVPAPREIAGSWTVNFPAGWGAPEKITLTNLISWTEHADAGVRYFSGTATYQTKFQVSKPGSQILLDLGRVEVIAEVWLNGKSLGTLWKPPFQYDVTGLLRDGENDLEIRVTNLWPNRLIGDEQFPDDCAWNGPWTSGGIGVWPKWLLKKQPRPEPRRLTFFTWTHWTKDDTLLPSGLLGPVTLHVSEKTMIDTKK